MMLAVFVILIFVFFQILAGGGSEPVDCINCVHGTSTGNGICKECNGNHFEDKRGAEC